MNTPYNDPRYKEQISQYHGKYWQEFLIQLGCTNFQGYQNNQNGIPQVLIFLNLEYLKD